MGKEPKRKWQGPDDESDAMYDDWRKNPDDPLPRLALADWLEEHDQPEWAAHLRAGAPVPERLDTYDWGAAFAYAGEVNGSDGTPNLDTCPPGDTKISVRPFSRRDVRVIRAADEGENDERNWLCAGELWDGRFFYLSAGCDYTGWG